MRIGVKFGNNTGKQNWKTIMGNKFENLDGAKVDFFGFGLINKLDRNGLVSSFEKQKTHS